MTARPARNGSLIAPARELEIAELGSAAGSEQHGADGDLAVRTLSATLRLEGGVARVVRDRILPVLSRPRSREDLLDELSDLPAAEIERLLRLLLDAGVLVELHDEVPGWLGMVTSSARAREAFAARLAALRVVLSGQAGVAGAGGRDGARRRDRRRCLPGAPSVGERRRPAVGGADVARRGARRPGNRGPAGPARRGALLPVLADACTGLPGGLRRGDGAGGGDGRPPDPGRGETAAAGAATDGHRRTGRGAVRPDVADRAAAAGRRRTHPGRTRWS